MARSVGMWAEKRISAKQKYEKILLCHSAYICHNSCVKFLAFLLFLISHIRIIHPSFLPSALAAASAPATPSVPASTSECAVCELLLVYYGWLCMAWQKIAVSPKVSHDILLVLYIFILINRFQFVSSYNLLREAAKYMKYGSFKKLYSIICTFRHSGVEEN